MSQVAAVPGVLLQHKIEQDPLEVGAWSAIPTTRNLTGLPTSSSGGRAYGPAPRLPGPQVGAVSIAAASPWPDRPALPSRSPHGSPRRVPRKPPSTSQLDVARA